MILIITVMPLFIGTTELLLIGGLALLLFGGKKLPEVMKGLGEGLQSFKKGMNEPILEKKKEESIEDVTEHSPEEKLTENISKKK